MEIKKIKKEQLLIVALFGILLLVITIPVPKEKTETLAGVDVAEENRLQSTEEEQLKKVLQTIAGVGRVEIFISYKDRGRFVVEKDETVSEELIEEVDGGGGKRKTTTVQNTGETVYGEGEIPLVVQEITPAIEGVLVVAEGGGNVEVKKQIEKSIVALFGLETHKISIMKMEVSK